MKKEWKRKILSFITAVSMILSLIGAMPQAASAATITGSQIKRGDYIMLGGIKWRCVAFEKQTGTDGNGNPIIDSTQTSKTYQNGYLPLMLADTSIGEKEFDAAGSTKTGYHDRYSNRTKNGSNYWGDSNIRDWLNSSAAAGNVTWSCGNTPSYKDEAGFLTRFSVDETNMIQTVTPKSIITKQDYDAVKKKGGNVSGSKEFGNHVSDESVLGNYEKAYSEQVTDTIFLLDIQQALNVHDNDISLGGSWYFRLSANYWSRSISNIARDPCNASFCVCSSGLLWDHYYVNNKKSIRPAFFLNPSATVECGEGTSGTPYRLHNRKQGFDENGHYECCIYCNQKLSSGNHTYRYSVNQHICTVCGHQCGHSRETAYKTETEHYKICNDCKHQTETEPHCS